MNTCSTPEDARPLGIAPVATPTSTPSDNATAEPNQSSGPGVLSSCAPDSSRLTVMVQIPYGMPWKRTSRFVA